MGTGVTGAHLRHLRENGVGIHNLVQRKNGTTSRPSTNYHQTKINNAKYATERKNQMVELTKEQLNAALRKANAEKRQKQASWTPWAWMFHWLRESKFDQLVKIKKIQLKKALNSAKYLRGRLNYVVARKDGANASRKLQTLQSQKQRRRPV